MLLPACKVHKVAEVILLYCMTILTTIIKMLCKGYDKILLRKPEIRIFSTDQSYLGSDDFSRCLHSSKTKHNTETNIELLLNTTTTMIYGHYIERMDGQTIGHKYFQADM